MYILDRFEGEVAVLEDDNGEMFSCPRFSLPAEAREGSCLISENGVLVIDAAATEARRQRLFARLQRLRQDPEQKK